MAINFYGKIQKLDDGLSEHYYLSRQPTNFIGFLDLSFLYYSTLRVYGNSIYSNQIKHLWAVISLVYNYSSSYLQE